MKITDKGSKKILIDDCNISLKDTFDCGQCFRWSFDGIGWVGVVGKRAVRCIQQENGFIIENTTVEDVENFWKVYFDLEKDYGSVVSEFSDDEYLTSAAEYGKGIRILRQEPLETIISFIISSNCFLYQRKLFLKPYTLARNTLPYTFFYSQQNVPTFS